MAEQASLDAFRSLYHEFLEKAKIDEVELDNPTTTEAVANRFFLKADTTDPQHLTFHFSTKNVFHRIVGAIRKLLHLGPTKGYDFVKNYNAITSQLTDIVRDKKITVSPQDRDMLERLQAILNAMASHVQSRKTIAGIQELRLFPQKAPSIQPPKPTPAQAQPTPTPAPAVTTHAAKAVKQANDFKQKSEKEITKIKNRMEEAKQQVNVTAFSIPEQELASLEQQIASHIQEADKNPSLWREGKATRQKLVQNLHELSGALAELISQCSELAACQNQIDDARSSLKPNLLPETDQPRANELILKLQELALGVQQMKEQLASGLVSYRDCKALMSQAEGVVEEAEDVMSQVTESQKQETLLYDLWEKYTDTVGFVPLHVQLSDEDKNKEAFRVGLDRLQSCLKNIPNDELLEAVAKKVTEYEGKLLTEHDAVVHKTAEQAREEAKALFGKAEFLQKMAGRRKDVVGYVEGDEHKAAIPEAPTTTPLLQRAFAIEFPELRKEALKILKLELPKSQEEAEKWLADFDSTRAKKNVEFEKLYQQVEERRRIRQDVLLSLAQHYQSVVKQEITPRIHAIKDSLQMARQKLGEDTNAMRRGFKANLSAQDRHDLDAFIDFGSKAIKQLEEEMSSLVPRIPLGEIVAEKLQKVLAMQLEKVAKTLTAYCEVLPSPPDSEFIPKTGQFLERAKDLLLAASKERFETKKGELASQLTTESTHYPFLTPAFDKACQSIELPSAPTKTTLQQRLAQFQPSIQKGKLETEFELYSQAIGELETVEQDLREVKALREDAEKGLDSLQKALDQFKEEDFEKEPRAIYAILKSLTHEYPRVFSEKIEGIDSLDDFLTQLQGAQDTDFPVDTKAHYVAEAKQFNEGCTFLLDEALPLLEDALRLEDLAMKTEELVILQQDSGIIGKILNRQIELLKYRLDIATFEELQSFMKTSKAHQQLHSEVTNLVSGVALQDLQALDGLLASRSGAFTAELLIDCCRVLDGKESLQSLESKLPQEETPLAHAKRLQDALSDIRDHEVVWNWENEDKLDLVIDALERGVPAKSDELIQAIEALIRESEAQKGLSPSDAQAVARLKNCLHELRALIQ